MSIVLHGLGLGDVDSGSTIVAFGIARDLDAGESVIDVLQSGSIENFFVIDYGSQFTRPLTEAEWRRFQQLIKMMLMGDVQFSDKIVNGKPGLKIWRQPIIRKAA